MLKKWNDVFLAKQIFEIVFQNLKFYEVIQPFGLDPCDLYLVSASWNQSHCLIIKKEFSVFMAFKVN